MISEAQNKAVKKYKEKTYVKYNVLLKKKEDKDIIEAIEASGLTCTAFLRRLWDQNKK